jgi:hypothetical protein
VRPGSLPLFCLGTVQSQFELTFVFQARECVRSSFLQLVITPLVTLSSPPAVAVFSAADALSAACSTLLESAKPLECDRVGRDTCSAGQPGSVQCTRDIY